LQSIRDYLREHHPSFTQLTVQKLYAAARSLRQFPNRGRIGQMENTRELVTLPLPYIIVYGVDADSVHVFRVLHGAEDRP
jgi:plasmid stabilization system protein ParE